MRYSQLLIPTTREVPAEAEIPSHQWMIRAGFIRKLASGTYTYLPLGLRCIQKIAQIIREEMNAAGAQEIDMPFVQPMELWEQTGRREDYGQTLGWFTDRHGRENVLAPTAEEIVTHLVASEIRSYKQLPVNLYQIKMKYRDEFRPRFGVLRSREFTMKDAYSFDATLEGLDASYRAMYDAYCNIFERCGVRYVVVEAQSGEIGGSGSQEFMIPCESGEDVIVHTEDGSYAANIEKAEVDAPAATRDPDADSAAPALQEVHTPDVGSIEAVCEFLGTQPAEMIKTLIYWKHDADVQETLQSLQNTIEAKQSELRRVEKHIAAARADAENEHLDNSSFEDAAEAEAQAQLLRDQIAEAKQTLCAAYGELDVLIALVRGDHDVNEHKLRAACGGAAIELADETLIEKLTGAKVGFAGPQGLHEKVCHLVIDHAVAVMPTGTTGANKTDHHVRHLVPGRDFPLEGDRVIRADIRNAQEGDTHDGKPLQFSRGIEVGHIFKLGTKYTEALGATFLDENGKAQPCIMGCYGIGVNRILASAIEAGHDQNGCILPPAIAPFEIEVIQLNHDKENVCTAAKTIYDTLREAGADVLLDDRAQRPGVKFKDADLLGIPLRIVVGERGLKDGQVEWKRRAEETPSLVAVDQAVQTVLDALAEMRTG
jgi:prolyl-tRNA synthetase